MSPLVLRREHFDSGRPRVIVKFSRYQKIFLSPTDDPLRRKKIPSKSILGSNSYLTKGRAIEFGLCVHACICVCTTLNVHI